MAVESGNALSSNVSVTSYVPRQLTSARVKRSEKANELLLRCVQFALQVKVAFKHVPRGLVDAIGVVSFAKSGLEVEGRAHITHHQGIAHRHHLHLNALCMLSVSSLDCLARGASAHLAYLACTCCLVCVMSLVSSRLVAVRSSLVLVWRS